MKDELPKALELPADAKPLTKAECYHVCRSLLQGIMRSEVDAGIITEQEAQGLLLYFAPSAGRVPKTPQDYVAKFAANPKTELRVVLQFLYSDGRHLFGTDGHTAAWCETDLEPGLYNARTMDRVANFDGKYPDIRRLLPKKEKHRPLNLDEWEANETGGVKSPLLYYRNPEGVAFNRDYIARCLKGSVLAHYQPAKDASSPMRGRVQFKSGEAAFFVVMPVRV